MEALLEIFVAGGIVILGAWYLNRPVLFEYFPAIAQDVNAMGESKLGGKALVFVILVLFAGVIITHLFDAVLPLIIENHRIRGAKGIKIKKILSYLLLIVSAPTLKDPRAVAIDRYMNSPRRDWFLQMAMDWSKTDEHKLQEHTEKVIVHQHLVNRLRVHSEDSRKVLQDAYQQLTFAGSIFIAVLLLLPFTGLAFWSQTLVDNTKYKVYSSAQLWYFLATIWFFSALSCYSLKRRARNFYSQVVTIAIHFHDQSKSPGTTEA